MIENVFEFLGLDSEVMRILFDVASDWWWLFAPPFLVFVFLDLWIMMKEREFIQSVEWVLLEITLPQDVLRTPKAMEQVFSGLHGLYDPPRWDQTLLAGKVQYWLSFEFVGGGGRGIRFFVRTPARYRNFVEAQIYSQYHDAEINEADDYVWDVPRKIPNEEYDMWGTEMKLAEPDGYPIKSYIEFEAPVEEQRLDPISSLAESMNTLKQGEHLWLQFVMTPTSEKWKDEGKKLIDKLMHRENKIKRPTAGGVVGDMVSDLTTMTGHVLSDVAGAIAGTAVGEGGLEEKKKEGPMFPIPATLLISPGERDVVESVERNISKLGYATRVRWIYIARRDLFSGANIAAITGFFKIFNTLHLNRFKHDSDTRTYVRRWLKARREYWRKLRLLPNYRNRRLYMSGTFRMKKFGKFVLNTEELATLYHFPGRVVGAPRMPRVEARRGEPPHGLPTGE